jgi:hypothetical protein
MKSIALLEKNKTHCQTKKKYKADGISDYITGHCNMKRYFDAFTFKNKFVAEIELHNLSTHKIELFCLVF